MRFACLFFALFLLPCFSFLHFYFGLPTIFVYYLLCVVVAHCRRRHLQKGAGRARAVGRGRGLSALISRPSRRQYLLCTRRQSRQEGRRAGCDAERAGPGSTKAGTPYNGRGATRGAQTKANGKAVRPAFLALDWRSLGILRLQWAENLRNLHKINVPSCFRLNNPLSYLSNITITKCWSLTGVITPQWESKICISEFSNQLILIVS